MKFPTLMNQLLLAASIVSLSCTQAYAQAINSTIAQSPNSGQSLSPSLFAAPPPPPDIGTPGQRRSEAGSRPQSCRQVDKSLTALVPAYPSKDSEIVWGTTIAEQPTLWFYVPYSSESASGEFVLENAAKQQTIQVPLAAKPGIIQVRLADMDVSLQANQRYHWYFNVYCQRNREEVDSYVEGDVTRQPLSLELQNRITQANLQQKFALFAANGIWHEALNIAAVLQCGKPDNPTWKGLLQNVGLSELAQEPIAQCRKPTK
jgi:hypothetical protein